MPGIRTGGCAHKVPFAISAESATHGHLGGKWPMAQRLAAEEALLESKVSLHLLSSWRSSLKAMKFWILMQTDNREAWKGQNVEWMLAHLDRVEGTGSRATQVNLQERQSRNRNGTQYLCWGRHSRELHGTRQKSCMHFPSHVYGQHWPYGVPSPGKGE